MPNVNYRGKLLSKDPDLMTEEELSAAFEAMPLPARQEAMRRALDEELGPMAPIQIADNVTEIPVAGWSSPVRITSMPPESGVTSIPLGAPWPPLSREQVVELHEALVEFCEKLDLRRGSWMDARVAWRLREAIRGMGIGSPPPTRTWTHEEVAKVAEEVQEEAPKRNCWSCKHSLGERGGWLCNTHNIEVLLWLGKPENSIGLREDGQMMPERTTDGCPGWEPKP